MDLRRKLQDTMQGKSIGQAQGKSISQAQVAKAIGMSPTVINLYLDNKYNGNVDLVERRIGEFLAQMEEESRTPDFVMPTVGTSIFKRIHAVLRTCHVKRKMGLIYGSAGLGKTEAVHAYCEENLSAILIESNPVYTPADVVRELYRKLIADPRGSTNDQLTAIMDRLNGSKRIIIVDEAEYLPPMAIELLRRIYDKSHIGIALCGLDRLKSNICGKQKDFLQVYSRMFVARRLAKLTPEDVEDIVREVLPDNVKLWPVFHAKSGGITRNLANLLENTITIAKVSNVPITAEVVDKAEEQLLI